MLQIVEFIRLVLEIDHKVLNKASHFICFPKFTVMCLKIGTTKMINFPFFANRIFMISGIPKLKHITVCNTIKILSIGTD